MNKEQLINEITALSEKLDTPIPATEGLTNAALETVVATLQQSVLDLPPIEVTPAAVTPEVPTAPPVASEPAVEVVSDGWVIGKGRNVTCRKGNLNPGEPITVADVPGGQDAFDILVKKGYVVEG